MKYRTLPIELTDNCFASDAIGTVRRVRHLRREDGTECTRDDQDAALAIKRTSKGWLYKCHRCGFKGAVDLDKTSPARVLEMMKPIPIPAIMSQDQIKLPDELVDVFNRGSIIVGQECPNVARELLLRFRINYDLANRHNIKYSKTFHRIIFPIYNTKIMQVMSDISVLFEPKLVGWTGRNPYFVKGGNEPKWLTRKSKDLKRPIYHLNGSGDAPTRYCIIVEDAISAIRIHNALDGRADVIALLNHSLPTNLVIAIKNVLNPRIVIWLDHDVANDTLNFWKMCNSIGVQTTYINSTNDPKSYDDQQIVELFNRSKGEHEKISTQNIRCAI